MGEKLKIFITGGTGFIGKHLIHALQSSLPDDAVVYVLVRSNWCLNDSRFVPVHGDLSNLSQHADIIRECHYIFHLAANVDFFSSDEKDNEINYLPTRRLVEIIQNHRVNLKNLIFISSIGACDRHAADKCREPLTAASFPAPTSIYGKSKLKSEQYIRQSGLPFTIIRPTWVYGSDMRTNSHINKFVSWVFQGVPVFRLNFPGRVSLIDVRDLALALTRCINNPQVVGKIYFATTETKSIGSIFSIIYEKIFNTNLWQIPVPRLGFFFSKFHSKLPLTITNLFLDYLSAEKFNFICDFRLTRPRLFIGGVQDVIDTNVHRAGFWVVTGANSGIGLALADRLSKGGKKLILVDKVTDNLSKYSDQIIMKVDLSDQSAVISFVDQIKSYKIYCLINNAGVGFKSDFDAMTLDNMMTTLKVNIEAPLLLTKMLVGNIVKNEGVIVNIASSAAHNPLPGMSIYAASKSFILYWSHSLWYELRGKCCVITVSPSGTNTNFQRSAGVRNDGGRGLMNVEQVAQMITKAIERRRPFIFLGAMNRIVALVTKLFPNRLNIYFWGKMFEKMR